MIKKNAVIYFNYLCYFMNAIFNFKENNICFIFSKKLDWFCIYKKYCSLANKIINKIKCKIMKKKILILFDSEEKTRSSFLEEGFSFIGVYLEENEAGIFTQNLINKDIIKFLFFVDLDEKEWRVMKAQGSVEKIIKDIIPKTKFAFERITDKDFFCENVSDRRHIEILCYN